MLALLASWAGAQTVAQSEASMGYLLRTACIEPNGLGGYRYAGGARTSCIASTDCSAPAACRHESLVLGAAALYPPLAHPAAPSAPGSGEGIFRYAPLCEDGSGDHEWAVSNGALGLAPTCAPADYIRCGDGSRPSYYLNRGTGPGDHFLIHAGVGGHASVPGLAAPVWASQFALNRGAYSNDATPSLHDQFEGIYDQGASNPFSTFHRVIINKCTADAWMGNADAVGLLDFTTEQIVSIQTPNCRDADGNGLANCDDRLVDPNACICIDRLVAPPDSPSHAYDVYYHGRRIVRSVLADLQRGAVGYVNYPLVDDGTGHARVRPGDERLGVIGAASKVGFSCHSAGCVGMEGGLLDDLHALVDATVGADVDVRGILNSFGNPAVEVEACVSEFDGVDVAPANGIADHPGVIDDTCSLYDQVVDTVAITGQPMSMTTYEPGGAAAYGVGRYYEPRPGYGPEVDQSCLDQHCPGVVDWWTDAACAPCNSPLHVLFNHLNTPVMYNEAQRDAKQVGLMSIYCDYAGFDPIPCDHDGDSFGVDLTTTHWRQLIRKQFADAIRYGELDRCEGGVGSEWPYDHNLYLITDLTTHAPVLKDMLADYVMDPAGPVGPTSMADATYAWMMLTSPSSPAKAACIQEATPGENAATFTAGGVPGCQ
ncbi:MAG: hypothetical protein H6735_30295 [Alphaproteobacteria bacterium]|nr:hypothetical protein [Alphaproteobacteria bacterium]